MAHDQLVESATLLARALGFTPALIESTDAGQDRSAYLTTDTGHELVLKWSGSPEWAGGVRRAQHFLETLRSRGYPAPATTDCVSVEGLGFGYAVHRAPGHPAITGLTPLLLDQVLGVVALQAEATEIDITSRAVDRDWSWVDACVYDDLVGWWAAAHQLAPKLTTRIRAWADELPRPITTTDYVHYDLNLSNLIVHHGHLSAVVDLDHLGLGDRTIDIAFLAFDQARLAIGGIATPDALDHLIAVGKNVAGEAAWRRAVAYSASARLGYQGEYGHRVPHLDAITATELILAASA